MPITFKVAASAVALLLAALCVGTAYAVLRPRGQQLVMHWPAWRVVVLLALASVPWLVAWLAPITINVRIHGLLSLIGWLLIGLACFSALILFPLAALLAGAVWCTARLRRRHADTRS